MKNLSISKVKMPKIVIIQKVDKKLVDAKNESYFNEYSYDDHKWMKIRTLKQVWFRY